MSKHLYNTKDISRAREEIRIRQNNIDPITKLSIPDKQAVLDHDHQTQYVRAVLHRQTNAVLGKIENLEKRYLSWWYEGSLSDFLRGCADYLDAEHPKEFVHPSFMKMLQVKFNKLNEADKQEFLKSVGEDSGCNSTQRKKLFKKFLMKRNSTMQEVSAKLDELLLK